MYTETVTTQEEALCHLLFHFCFKDGHFSKSEIGLVSDRLVAAGLHNEMDFTAEIVKYKSYRDQLTDEEAYLQHLIKKIMPVNELALFSVCVELCLSDAELGTTEDALLRKLAAALEIEASEEELIKKLMTQRKVVETQKVF
ncbi:MAG TPA: TerB family tellurite resistance protein [Chitinophagaceae bacterium]|nr:TerB family tellurite resistance protein [Chitinophagaceae bacterium]